jgi:hypothetical protein
VLLLLLLIRLLLLLVGTPEPCGHVQELKGSSS